MAPVLSRRTVLAGATGAVGLAVAGSNSAHARPARAKRVAVLGAGLAGLAAAYELHRADPTLRIVVLDGRRRVGGRVLTARTDEKGRPFDDGQHVELGAHRIPSNHDRTLGYIAELGLSDQVVPFRSELPDGRPSRRKYVLRGTASYSDEAWPAGLQLTAGERADIGGAYWDYEYRFVDGDRPPVGSNQLGDISVPPFAATPWPYGESDPASVDAWDKVTLDQFLTANGASGDFLRIYKADNGSEPRSISALSWLVQDVLHREWFDTLYLDGGLDQIPLGLAERLSGAGVPVLGGHEVIAIEQDRGGATIRYRDTARAVRTMAVDRVVCALPFSAMRGRRVDVRRSGLSAAKRYWIANLAMVPSARIALQTHERFWQDEGLEGLHLAGTDTDVERVWHSTHTQEGTAGILQTYLQDANAAAAPTRGTTTWMRDRVASQVFPQLSTGVGWNGKGRAKLWHRDEWTHGAWASPRPGDLVRGFATWGRAEGRIHFAGEHTSLFSGWMQGALESGQRASAEVLSEI
jgi:monoamine oxidase